MNNNEKVRGFGVIVFALISLLLGIFFGIGAVAPNLMYIFFVIPVLTIFVIFSPLFLFFISKEKKTKIANRYLPFLVRLTGVNENKLDSEHAIKIEEDNRFRKNHPTTYRFVKTFLLIVLPLYILYLSYMFFIF